MRALEKKIYDYLEAHREDIVADLAALARAESPTGDKAAADACARLLASLYKDRLGAATQFVPQTEVGDHLVTEIGSGGRTLLIVGHYDTVHPLGTVPVHREGDVLYGPGVVDMKGGDISVIWALKALQELGVKLDKKVLIVNNSDEETGSFHSRPLLLEKAKEAYACIVAEPAVAKSGLIKVSRKGGGQILIKCWGKAAHSGNDPRGGVNANIELAHQILFAESRSDYGPGGSTFSANVIRGGTADNVVCDYAEAVVDWRMCVPEEVERGHAVFAGRGAVLPGARVEFEIKLSHPPLAECEANRKLFALLQQVGADLDMELEASPMVGGCSDGNDISAAGVPTIDGMGVVGDFMHNPQEQVYLDQLVPRVAMMASFISRV